MARTFLPFDLNQPFLLPPDIRDWLPEKHLARFILDLVDTLDLSDLMHAYIHNTDAGRSGYHPKMLLGLVLYAYCTGTRSSRQIERRTYEDVAYRVLSGNQHPDHDTIASFRQRHLDLIAKLFVQVLLLCQKAGLVKLGNIAIDGTKVKANASKHKAMSYDRMCETEKRLAAEVKALLAAAAQADAEEDGRFGKGKRGDELPEELARRESRLVKIRAAKAALEQEAKEKAERAAAEARAKNEKRRRKEEETGKKMGGRPAEVPDAEKAVPEPKAQRNFTDPESRIMKDGSSKSFEQAYNAQAAVDSSSQVIVGTLVTQAPNDKEQLVPMLLRVQEQAGALPESASADAGYFGAKAITDPRISGVDLYVPPDRQKHGDMAVAASDPTQEDVSVIEKMREKLKTVEGQAIYKQRKAVVEPVFGQIKEARGIRRFSFRGMPKVLAEWDIVCLTHNVLKLFRAGVCLRAVEAG